MIKWQNVKQHCNLSHPLGLDCECKVRHYKLWIDGFENGVRLNSTIFYEILLYSTKVT